MTHLRDTQSIYIYSIYEENHGNRFYHSCHANDADWDALPTRI